MLCNHSVVKLHEATQMLVMVDYVSSVNMVNMDHFSICSSYLNELTFPGSCGSIKTFGVDEQTDFSRLWWVHRDPVFFTNGVFIPER